MVQTSLPARWQASPSFDERRPNVIVLHYTGGASLENGIRDLTEPQMRVSAHYVVGRDGSLYQLVDERKRAWHAGESRWGNDTDLNSTSIGIEIDNDGVEPYPDVQIDALLALLRDLVERHRIPQENVVGHADVAPSRKVDPGRLFPWERLAAEGFGLWCEPVPGKLPATFDPLVALRVVGYDTSDPALAIRAFRLHYAHDDATELTERDRALLACLQAKRMAGK
jgi:N-acetylmuramoyl-L-alanine amidase